MFRSIALKSFKINTPYKSHQIQRFESIFFLHIQNTCTILNLPFSVIKICNATEFITIFEWERITIVVYLLLTIFKCVNRLHTGTGLILHTYMIYLNLEGTVPHFQAKLFIYCLSDICFLTFLMKEVGFLLFIDYCFNHY